MPERYSGVKVDYSFNSNVAKIYGVDEAVFIHNMYWWIAKNKANGKHFYDGKTWTYNSMQAFTELFPFWTRRQVERIIRNLKEKGAIQIGNYNKVGFDRTSWYSLSETVESIYANGEPHFTERCNGNNETVEPIPDIKPDGKLTDIKPSCRNCESSDDEIKPKKEKKVFDRDSNPHKLARLLAVCIQDNKPDASFSETTIQSWADEIDKLIRLDKAKVDDIAEVIQWCQKDDFWKANILSGKALRKQFLRLSIKALQK